MAGPAPAIRHLGRSSLTQFRLVPKAPWRNSTEALPMTHPLLAAAIIATLLAPGAAQAVETSVTINLATQSDFERRVMHYDCAVAEPLTVTYINAAPNFLALVPIAEEPEELVFTAVIAAS